LTPANQHRSRGMAKIHYEPTIREKETRVLGGRWPPTITAKIINKVQLEFPNRRKPKPTSPQHDIEFPESPACHT